MTEVYFDNKNKDESKTPPKLSNLQEFIEAAAKANGVSTHEAAAALEENGWDVLIIEQLQKKQ